LSVFPIFLLPSPSLTLPIHLLVKYFWGEGYLLWALHCSQFWKTWMY
jgi:hypothetical protein